VVLEELHHPQPIHLFLLVQGDKLKLLRVLGYISERTFYCVQVVGSNGGVFPCPAKSIMKLLLCCDEGLICFLVKRHISEDGCSYKGPDLLYLGRVSGTEGSTTMEVVGGERVMTGAFICWR